MFRSAGIAIFGLALILGPLATGTAAADPQCKKVHGHLFLEAEAVPTCGSPIGLCATVTLQGSIQATSQFVGSSALVTVDTPTTGVIAVTGDNAYQTSRGTIFTKDAIVLSTVGDGEFAEVDTIVGGTGAYAGATGTLVGTGTFANGAGSGVIDGEICTP